MRHHRLPSQRAGVAEWSWVLWHQWPQCYTELFKASMAVHWRGLPILEPVMRLGWLQCQALAPFIHFTSPATAKTKPKPKTTTTPPATTHLFFNLSFPPAPPLPHNSSLELNSLCKLEVSPDPLQASTNTSQVPVDSILTLSTFPPYKGIIHLAYITTTTMTPKQPPSTPSAPRIGKACDECRRKRERCNPSHHLSAASASPVVKKASLAVKSPAPSIKTPSPGGRKAATSPASRSVRKQSVRTGKACADCRRKKVRCDPSHHTQSPSSASVSPTGANSSVSSASSSSLSSLSGTESEYESDSDDDEPVRRKSLVVTFHYSPADLLASKNANLAAQDMAGSSRDASSAPTPAEVRGSMPSILADHGAPLRQYVNKHLTPYILEGMKQVCKDR